MTTPHTKARSLLEMEPQEWQRALNLADEDLPIAVISEGSWWRADRTKWRLSTLTNVRELAFPDMFLGRWHGQPIVYCCAYGAQRAAEVAHVFGSLGAKLAIQIGTCGGLQRQLRPGDIVIPDDVVCSEGVAAMYGADGVVVADTEASATARLLMEGRGHTVHRGTHLTWYSIFAQDGPMVVDWHARGYTSVDMETATTLAVAKHFGMAAVSMLVVWDDLLNGRSFLDALSQREQRLVDAGNRAVYEVALELVDSL